MFLRSKITIAKRDLDKCPRVREDETRVTKNISNNIYTIVTGRFVYRD